MNLNVLRRLRVLLEELPPAERAVAEVILREGRDGPHLSISEVALHAGTSKTTVLRLCRRLGFNSFKDFRLALAREADSLRESLDLSLVTPEDDGPILVAKVRKLHTEAIHTALANVDPAELERVGRVLLDARSIKLFACGGAAVTAMDAHHKLLRLGLNTCLSLDQREQKMLAGVSRPGDVVWAFSFSGATSSLVEALRIARDAGAAVVSLTNNRESPIAELSDFKLFGVTNYLSHLTGTLEFRLSQLSILDSLFLVMIKLGLPEVSRHLQRTQEIIEADLLKRSKYPAARGGRGEGMEGDGEDS